VADQTGQLDIFSRPRSDAWKELSADDLAALLLLDEVRFFGPQKFRHLFELGIAPRTILDDPESVAAVGGKRTEEFARRISELALLQRGRALERASDLLRKADRLEGRVLSYGDEWYPPILLKSNYPIPLLFVRGSLSVLSGIAAVACVGSRKIRPPYSELHKKFATYAAERGFTIVSGFALGADSIGHRAALSVKARTIAVLPGGLDRPFPPENKVLWQEFLDADQAALVSEAPFGLRASSLTLRRRNKLIAGMSLGVLVTQSATKGGAMNAFRFALEDKKPVATFRADSRDDVSGNKVISADSRAKGPVFGLDGSEEEFEQWLAGLDSST